MRYPPFWKDYNRDKIKKKIALYLFRTLLVAVTAEF